MNSRKILSVLLLLVILPISSALTETHDVEGKWRLKELKSGDVRHDGVTLCMGGRASRSAHYDFRPYIDFKPHGSFSAGLCCGNSDGIYTTGDNGSIALRGFTISGPACFNTQFEDEDILSILKAVDKAETRSDELTLTAAKKGAILVYTRELPPATPEAVSTLTLSCTFAIPKASVSYGKKPVNMTENNFHVEGSFTAAGREKKGSTINVALSAETSGERMRGDVTTDLGGPVSTIPMNGNLKRGVDGTIINFFISTVDGKYILNCSAVD